jgi:hypothetical protein
VTPEEAAITEKREALRRREQRAPQKERLSDSRPLLWFLVVAGGAVSVGAFVGFGVGAATYKPDPSAVLNFGRGFNEVVGVFVGGVVGFFAGLVLWYWSMHRRTS